MRARALVDASAGMRAITADMQTHRAAAQFVQAVGAWFMIYNELL